MGSTHSAQQESWPQLSGQGLHVDNSIYNPGLSPATLYILAAGARFCFGFQVTVQVTGMGHLPQQMGSSRVLDPDKIGVSIIKVLRNPIMYILTIGSSISRNKTLR